MQENSKKVVLLTLFGMAFSLSIAMLAIRAPVFLTAAVITLIFLPYISPSTTVFVAVTNIYNILARPILYIWAFVVTIKGPQDYLAIAFYIIAGVQVISIVKNFIVYLSIFIKAIKSR